MRLVGLLAVCGMLVSAVSLQHHYATSKTVYCNIGETFNCDIVNRSEYSTIFGVPVALIGILGYASIAALASLYRKRRDTPALLFGITLAGLAFALYLTYLEAHVLGVWCILCLSSLAIIALTTILAVAIWWQAKEGSSLPFS